MESKGSRFFFCGKKKVAFVWCPYVTPAEALNFYVVGNIELGNWTVGIAVVQVLVAATWACGKMLATEVQVGAFKPNMFPKPTKGMHCLLVVVSKHLLFKIELSLLIPSKSSWQKIIRSSKILRRSHNEIYMISSYCIKSSRSLDPLESDGWRKGRV